MAGDCQPIRMMFLTVCAAILLCFTSAEAVSISAFASNQSDVSILLIGVVSLCVIVIVSVVLLFLCTDCYNTEVASTNHPACGGNKSGGAGYFPANTSDVNNSVLQSSYDSNDIVSPSSGSGPLPYSMIPTQVPEHSGFRGYQTAPAPGTAAGYQPGSPGGMMGYSGGGGAAQYGGRVGGHINPMDPPQEPPPPPYREALHGFQ